MNKYKEKLETVKISVQEVDPIYKNLFGTETVDKNEELPEKKGVFKIKRYITYRSGNINEYVTERKIEDILRIPEFQRNLMAFSLLRTAKTDAKTNAVPTKINKDVVLCPTSLDFGLSIVWLNSQAAQRAGEAGNDNLDKRVYVIDPDVCKKNFRVINQSGFPKFKYTWNGSNITIELEDVFAFGYYKWEGIKVYELI